MSVHFDIKVTDEGLFVPSEAYRDFGEIEVVRGENYILIKPKNVTADKPYQVDWKEQVRQALGLSAEELEEIIRHKPSPAELREEISRHIPPGMKFSDEIIAMREE